MHTCFGKSLVLVLKPSNRFECFIIIIIIIIYHTKSQQIKCWFLVRGEDQSTQGKTSQGRIGNQQTQPSLAFILRYMMLFSFTKLFLKLRLIYVHLKIIIICESLLMFCANNLCKFWILHKVCFENASKGALCYTSRCMTKHIFVKKHT